MIISGVIAVILENYSSNKTFVTFCTFTPWMLLAWSSYT